MDWRDIETAPFDRDLEIAVLDIDGPHSVAFPCRRTLNGWINAETETLVKVFPTHWRHWTWLRSHN